MSESVDSLVLKAMQAGAEAERKGKDPEEDAELVIEGVEV